VCYQYLNVDQCSISDDLLWNGLMTLSGNYPRQRQGIARLSLVVLLYSIWMFVYFLCFQTPPKHGEIWHADAWQPCPGLLSVFVSIGVVVTKNDIFKQKYLNVNKHFAALTAWQACAINSITINSSGYVLGQSSYSHPTGSNSLSHIISFYGLCLWSVYVFVCRVTHGFYDTWCTHRYCYLVLLIRSD